MCRATPVDPGVAEAVEDPDAVGMDERFGTPRAEGEESSFGVIPAVPAASVERREPRALDDESPRGQQDRTSQPGFDAHLGMSVVDHDHGGVLTLAVGCPAHPVVGTEELEAGEPVVCGGQVQRAEHFLRGFQECVGRMEPFGPAPVGPRVAGLITRRASTFNLRLPVQMVGNGMIVQRPCSQEMVGHVLRRPAGVVAVLAVTDLAIVVDHFPERDYPSAQALRLEIVIVTTRHAGQSLEEVAARQSPLPAALAAEDSERLACRLAQLDLAGDVLVAADRVLGVETLLGTDRVRRVDEVAVWSEPCLDGGQVLRSHGQLDLLGSADQVGASAHPASARHQRSIGPFLDEARVPASGIAIHIQQYVVEPSRATHRRIAPAPMHDPVPMALATLTALPPEHCQWFSSTPTPLSHS